MALSRLVISIPKASADGKWYGRYPQGDAPVTSSAVPMKMVGRALTTYTSSNSGAGAVDSTYHDNWQPTGDPSYIAIDISGVVGAMTTDGGGFKSMLMAFYTQDAAYQPNLFAQGSADIQGNYTIDVNPAAGGTYPTTGWTTMVTVTGNVVHSRSHIVNVAGMNWIRLSISQQADGSTSGSQIHIDLWDASTATNSAHTAVNAGWIDYGDSITHRTMLQDTVGPGGPSYTAANALINAIKGFTPLQECAGMDGWKSSDLAAQIATWITYFPGRYCTLTIGTNDATASVVSATYSANVTTILNAITGAGKIPVVSTIPWSSASPTGANVPGLNAALAALKSSYPSWVDGPDFYTLFQNGTIAMDPDGIHPSNPTGCETMRNTWANFMASLGGGA